MIQLWKPKKATHTLLLYYCSTSVLSMDLKSPPCLYPSSHLLPSTPKLTTCNSVFQDSPLEPDHPFFDPLCKFNLRETSEFVNSFPMASTTTTTTTTTTTKRLQQQQQQQQQQQRRVEPPSTPGRPVFSFSAGRKSIPSKWDDAEKWLTCHDSPAHTIKPDVSYRKGGAFEDKVLSLNPERDVSFLKDKFTANAEPAFFPSFPFSEATKEAFVLRNSSYCEEPMKDSSGDEMVHRRDVGTAMTPRGSSTTSRCHTPVKSPSPARHNTPANRSGPLGSTASIDISELQDCHFAKLRLSAQYDSMFSNWSSREEEEEEVSRSLRHSEMVGGRRSVAESRASALEDEERTKSCIRYQREEAKIQAWVNFQSAKAEAQSRKLEVKIQRMRSNLEDKLSKRMAAVHRRAEEWRGAAQVQHSQQMLRASEQALKMRSQPSQLYDHHASCGCFPLQ